MNYFQVTIFLLLAVVCFCKFWERMKQGFRVLAFIWLGIGIFELIACYGFIRRILPIQIF